MELTPVQSRIDRLAVTLATGLHISYIPFRLMGPAKWTGAGVLGTLEGFALLPLVPQQAAAAGATLAAAAVVASLICGRAQTVLGRKDDPRIVLDEIVGAWGAMAFLPRTPKILLSQFLLFRLFDSAKPPPLKALERLPGGWGVVADDLGAALAANLLVRLLFPIWPWLLA